ncbi:hypothetical protein [Paenibacillus wynnii]|uniref:Uncharacterized protein n=1 Tax=Paenibacillus wynnii TaxID=268407 RepID=A0A098M2M5_9BACL|nr:hypothetical protein [Paenibacillus wynnii]KGE16640.1 hypothetical protein PWYN_18195 [Paenibacillus wynnii]
MKTVRLSLINRQGQIINTWSIPYARRIAALDVAMDRAEEEGHAGVLWSVFNKGKTQEFAFDSHNPWAIALFAAQIQPFMTKHGTLDIDRFMRQPAKGAGADATTGYNRARYQASRS